MSLATRCPHCDTLFRVSLSQLQVHKGLVRCGSCQSIFSGVEQLTAADTEVWRRSHLSFEQTKQEPTEQPPQVVKPKFLSDQKKTKHFQWPTLSQAPQYFKPVAFTLLIGFIIQAIWWQRVPIAEQFPSIATWIKNSEPTIQWLFSQPATTLQVQGSGLSRINQNGLQVDLTLHNSNRLPSKWPHIQIQLIDPQSNTIAVKVLKPSDYVKRSDLLSAKANPIEAGQTVEVIAFLNLAQLNQHLPNTTATGFEIQLFDGSFELPH